MKKHSIALSTLKAHDNARVEKMGGLANIWTTYSPTSSGYTKHGLNGWRHHVLLPGKYRLPFRLDMTVKLDYPSFYVLVGSGHVKFATLDYLWVQDIAMPLEKPVTDKGIRSNVLPLGEFTDISVIYNFDEMQVLVDGEERFYSRKLAYMKKKNCGELDKINGESFPIGLAVSKLSTLTVKSMTVTEFAGKAPIVRGEEVTIQPFTNELPKFSFENVLAKAPTEFSNEVIETDAYLKWLRPLKFRRGVNKYEHGAKITYVASDYGISYAIVISNTKCYHDFGWYIVYNGPVETWHRKADYMEEILAEISKTDQPLAERVFYALLDCTTCYTHGLCKTPYAFNGQNRLTCHGRVHLRMCHDDFNDARKFFRHLNGFIEQKIANGEPPPEKIILSKGGI